MDYAQFRKAHPATRCFQPYTSDERAGLAASHRVGHRRRHAVGEFFYVHEMVPDRAYGTAKAATTAAYEVYLQGLRIAMQPLRIEPVAVEHVEEEGAAEDEAANVTPARLERLR